MKIAILVPTYGRPEYTELCARALEADKRDNYKIFYHPGTLGLRNAIIDFFEAVDGYDIIAKIDNDCVVPKNWMEEILDVFEKSDADILSPNVYPSNVALNFKVERGILYRPSPVIGGLWVMKKEMIDNIHFERLPIGKIKGAVPILRQIVNIKNPKMGWVAGVVVEDLGHWSGKHPNCIKTEEHRKYYKEVGREIAW